MSWNRNVDRFGLVEFLILDYEGEGVRSSMYALLINSFHTTYIVGELKDLTLHRT